MGETTEKYLCRMLRLPTLYHAILIVELLISTHLIVIIFTHYLQGISEYYSHSSEINELIPYVWLLPLAAFQSLRLVSIMASIISVQTVMPYLMIPHVTISIVWFFFLIFIITGVVQNCIKVMRVSVFAGVLMMVCGSYALLEFYSLSIHLFCFRWLVHKKKSVTSKDTNSPQNDRYEIEKGDDRMDTFSTRSTVIVNDDYLVIPS